MLFRYLATERPLHMPTLNRGVVNSNQYQSPPVKDFKGMLRYSLQYVRKKRIFGEIEQTPLQLHVQLLMFDLLGKTLETKRRTILFCLTYRLYETANCNVGQNKFRSVMLWSSLNTDLILFLDLLSGVDFEGIVKILLNLCHSSITPTFICCCSTCCCHTCRKHNPQSCALLAPQHLTTFHHPFCNF